uniref:Fibronectin type-III domain-containing protein n=1 Tax=Hippocampus comes TaxID=109280 RepID=A0A3Q2XK19_HIPCM
VYSCSSGMVTVTWDLVFGANLYRATAVDGTGASLNCTSASDSCQVTMLKCGEQYRVHVTAISDDCESIANTSTVFETGECSLDGLRPTPSHFTLLPSHMQIHSSMSPISWPTHDDYCTRPCDPLNVTAVLQCGSDAATVSWHASAGAASYHVLAYASQHQTSCWSMSTSCQLNGLQCGATYNLTVVAEGSSRATYCKHSRILSKIKSHFSSLPAPCSPYFENSTQICGTNSSIVSWMPVDDATGYIINARATSGHLVSCNSAIPTCALTDLECGATYTATIVAQGSQCDSPPGPPANITTAPCPPAVISKQYMCGSNTAVLSWSDTFGRLGFQAEIAGYGYQETCRTTNTSCVVHNLPCGLDLNVTVQAEGEHCNSTPSVCHSLQTAPCAPVNISATLVCFNHSALVSWVGSSSAVEYTVTSTGQNGHTHQCHSNTTSCQLSHIHFSFICLARLSPGLCSPSNVTISPPCEDNNTVSWSSVTGAEMYIATATADDGHTHTCSSNASTSCQFTDLHCGQNYSVAVVTVDRGCLSEPSSAVEVTTGVLSSCLDTKSAMVSWLPGLGAASYVADLTASSGHTTTCTTNETHCLLGSLPCGEQYNVSVASVGDTCDSTERMSGYLTTGTV